jgi:hypothetical protein
MIINKKEKEDCAVTIQDGEELSRCSRGECQGCENISKPEVTELPKSVVAFDRGNAVDEPTRAVYAKVTNHRPID